MPLQASGAGSGLHTDIRALSSVEPGGGRHELKHRVGVQGYLALSWAAAGPVSSSCAVDSVIK